MIELSRVVFLSVRPAFAEAILQDRKDVELRRRPPAAEPGTIVFLYASSPVCALVGAFVLRGVEQDSPTRLWARVGRDSGVGRADFLSYFHPLPRASALRIGSRWRLTEVIKLERIRGVWTGFQPPQSFRYAWAVRKGDTAELHLSSESRGSLRLRDSRGVVVSGMRDIDD